MGVILVIQPDATQAKVLHDVARRIHAELVIVNSTVRAVEAIERQVPDLILVSQLLSPRDEDTLIARLRSLEGASHLQTVSIPQFRSNKETTPGKKSAFGFGKKKKPVVAVGADPAVFAEEVAALLTRAKEMHSRPAMAVPVVISEPPAPAQSERAWDVACPVAQEEDVEPADSEIEWVSRFSAEPMDAASSVFEPPPVAQPFRAASSSSVFEPSAYLSIAEADAIDVANHEPACLDATVEEPIFEPVVLVEPSVEPALPGPDAVEVAGQAPALSMAEEIDQLVRQLGLDISLQEANAAAGFQPDELSGDDVFDFGASLDRARNRAGESTGDLLPQIDADAIREAAIAEARATAEREAREASAAEIARVLAEAEKLRETAISEARAAAETEARQALEADRLRAQAESEQMRESAIAEARAVAEREARDTLAAEVARVRSEAELTFSDALNKVRVEAEEAERRGIEAERAKARQLNEEAQRAFALELAKVRAEVEQSLTAQLDAARAEAERVRLAEAEAVRARAAVEHQLKADLERLRFVTAQTRKADESETKRAAQLINQLEAELATVRAKAEERKDNELEEIRAQMQEMREAAAEQARAAAAEAVAAEVARATVQAAAAVAAPRPTAVIAQFPSREVMRDVTREEPAEQRVTERHVSDYLRLWETRAVAPVQTPERVEPETPVESLLSADDVRRHAKWALPVAACLLLVANAGTGINTLASLVKPDERPALTVRAMQEPLPFIEVVERRVGRLQVTSTPSGAEVILDGKKHGRTPATIQDLDVGLHTLVLKSAGGTVTRKVTIKPNQTTQLTESIYSGWLALFSPIPVSIRVDGQPVSPTEDGRVMTTPGTHVVEFRNEQFGYRASETLEVRPGATTAHTVVLPMGTLRVKAPEGAEVRVDGQPPAGVPSEGVRVAIGAHEVSATHPELGARRAAVDVKHDGVTEVTLQFE